MEIVNGYVCNDCTDVANAKKGVDPAHPKDGPAGATQDGQTGGRGPAVTFGGSLAASSSTPSANEVEAVRPAPYAPGASVSLKV